MVRKMQYKFTGIATVSILLVLIVVLGMINFVNFSSRYEKLYNNLNFILENNGKIPDNLIMTSGEDPYRLRFFVLHFKNGKVTSVDVSHMATINEKEAMRFVPLLTEEQGNLHQKSKEFDLHYAYVKNKTMAIVCDCSFEINAATEFLKYSCLLGFISVLGFIMIFSYFSKEAIKPYIRNIENQKRFITNASHELKTPIAIISANTELLEAINGSSEWTKSIINQTNRLSQLIENLLILSRLQEDESVITKFSLSEKLMETSKEFEKIAQKQGKTLKTDIWPDVVIQSDQYCMSHMIEILIDNAVKYCDKEGLILVSLKQEKHLILDISNSYQSGENMDYSRFFERFYRGDTSHSNETKGYGIGLSMAEEFAEKLKGKLSVQYEDGMIHFIFLN